MLPKPARKAMRFRRSAMATLPPSGRLSAGANRASSDEAATRRRRSETSASRHADWYAIFQAQDIEGTCRPLESGTQYAAAPLGLLGRQSKSDVSDFDPSLSAEVGQARLRSSRAMTHEGVGDATNRFVLPESSLAASERKLPNQPA